MISAQPITNYPEQFLSNSLIVSTELILPKQENLGNFLATYNIVSSSTIQPYNTTFSNTAIYCAASSFNQTVKGNIFSALDLIVSANNLFSQSRPLTGEYMDLLDITFRNSMSKTPYEI